MLSISSNKDLVLRQLGKLMRVAVPIALGASEAIELVDKVKALLVEQVEALVTWLGER